MDTVDRPRLTWPVAALVGVLALVAALAAGHVVAAFVGPNASPFLAVGNSAIDLTPPAVKDFAVTTFGTYDKLVLLLGMAVTMLLAAVLAGVLSRRSRTPGMVVIGAFGVVGVVAVLNRPDLGQIALVAPLASMVVGLVVFRWLHGLAARRPEPGEPGGGASRRTFMVGSAGVAIGAGLVGGLGQVFGSRVDIEASRAEVAAALKRAKPAPAIPAGAGFPDLGTPRFLTENRDFYRVDTALTVPRVRADEWRLRVHGLVDRELDLDFADISGRPLVERTITMTCVSNEVGGPYVSTSNFIGVPMRDLLMDAGVRQGADQLYSTSVDGWTTGTPLDTLLDAERGALLAIGMNGEPLPVEHGFPARIVVPGLYGYVSATKWVTDMEVTRFGEKTFYWQDRGWAERAPIKTQSRIDVPRGFATLSPGKVTVAGIAWAQTTGIERVEVRVDGGDWRTATLSTEVNDQTWRMWRIELDLPEGLHRAEVRATDRSGYTQTEARVPPIPDGATGWHSTQFTVG